MILWLLTVTTLASIASSADTQCKIVDIGRENDREEEGDNPDLKGVQQYLNCLKTQSQDLDSKNAKFLARNLKKKSFAWTDCNAAKDSCETSWDTVGKGSTFVKKVLSKRKIRDLCGKTCCGFVDISKEFPAGNYENVRQYLSCLKEKRQDLDTANLQYLADVLKKPKWTDCNAAKDSCNSDVSDDNLEQITNKKSIPFSDLCVKTCPHSKDKKKSSGGGAAAPGPAPAPTKSSGGGAAGPGPAPAPTKSSGGGAAGPGPAPAPTKSSGGGAAGPGPAPAPAVDKMPTEKDGSFNKKAVLEFFASLKEAKSDTNAEGVGFISKASGTAATKCDELVKTKADCEKPVECDNFKKAGLIVTRGDLCVKTCTTKETEEIAQFSCKPDILDVLTGQATGDINDFLECMKKNKADMLGRTVAYVSKMSNNGMVAAKCEDLKLEESCDKDYSQRLKTIPAKALEIPKFTIRDVCQKTCGKQSRTLFSKIGGVFGSLGSLLGQRKFQLVEVMPLDHTSSTRASAAFALAVAMIAAGAVVQVVRRVQHVADEDCLLNENLEADPDRLLNEAVE